jgi:adenosylcobinamide-phosphate synthase
MFLLFSAYLLDLLLGDPEWLPHPIRGIGKLISFLEKPLRKIPNPRLSGSIFALLIIAIVVILTQLFLSIATTIHPILGKLAWVYLAYVSLAIKDLSDKSRKVAQSLEKKNLSLAKIEVSKIVSRDTQNLDAKGITRATLESIAENTTDGIIAPLFYLCLGGPLLGMAYKTINTLDSMVGYKNEQYLHFGWFSARLDDIANFIPARISGLLLTIASLIKGYDFMSAWRVMWRDARKHPSPNSGIPEAAVAGALGVRLGGEAFYQAQRSFKPFIGVEKQSLEPFLIERALVLTRISSSLMVLGAVLFLWKV